MDKRKKYIAVIDTETLGVTTPLIYDLGVTITDKKGVIYFQQNWLVKEVFEDQPERMRSAYYANKLPQYYDLIERELATVTPWLEIRAEFNEILEHYNVKVVSAYNLGFDRNAISFTHADLGNKGKFLTKSFEMWDIWGMATQTILRQKAFRQMAFDNLWFTPKGNLLTNAEVSYRYITNNLEFQEHHTALHDTEIETAILARCLRQHKRMKKGILDNPWKFAQAL